MTSALRTTSDYETLRAAVLAAEPARGPDLGIVRHHGLANWLKEPALKPIDQHPCARQVRISAAALDPALASSELIRLIASIVVALAAEPNHG